MESTRASRGVRLAFGVWCVGCACVGVSTVSNDKPLRYKQRDFFTMTATDAWIVFGDSHMIPHDDIALCEGWPKGAHVSVELFRCANVLPQAPWAPAE